MVQHSTSIQYTIDRNRFQMTSNLAINCIVIHNALSRYTDLLFIDSRFSPKPALTMIEALDVQVWI